MANKEQYKKAWQDLAGAFKNWRIWVLLGWQDIKLRYRRSMLGPFWITLSITITIYSMGFLYGHLFKMDLAVYFPYLAAGIISWALISTIISEGTDVFITSDAYLKQIKLPYFCFIFRMIFRNVLIFLHNVIAFLPLIFLFHIPINIHTLVLPLALLLICINAGCYSMLFAIVGSRYRDLTQIIINLVQVAFFLTPIMWMPNLLPERYQFAIHYNPLAQFVALLRSAFLGQPLSTGTLHMVAAVTAIGLIFCAIVFSRYRARIIFWL